LSLCAKIVVSAMRGIKKTGLIKGPGADLDAALRRARDYNRNHPYQEPTDRKAAYQTIQIGQFPCLEIKPENRAGKVMLYLHGCGDIRKKKPIRFPFSGTWLQRLAYAVLRRYASFANKRVDSGQWKNAWKFAVNPENHKNGISMPLMHCPVAAFAKKHGYEHLMPLFCDSDFKVAERYGLRLIREHTEAEGFPDCDFWYLMENDAER